MDPGSRAEDALGRDDSGANRDIARRPLGRDDKP